MLMCRSSRVAVLPEPGPAITTCVPSIELTTCCCCSLSSIRYRWLPQCISLWLPVLLSEFCVRESGDISPTARQLIHSCWRHRETSYWPEHASSPRCLCLPWG